MPRPVDRQQRRREILEAGMKVLAADGLSGFSFRAIADRLDGSVTLITHYYKSRQALLDDLASNAIKWRVEEFEAVEKDLPSGRERLALALEWLVPITDEQLTRQRARLALIGHPTPLKTRHLIDHWDAAVREALESHLHDVVAPQNVDLAVDLLRTIVNGLTFSRIEEPEMWTPDRMRSVLKAVEALLDSLEESPALDAKSMMK